MPDMIDVKIEDKQVTKHLERLAKKGGDLSRVMRDISEDMLDAVLENFSREGRPGRWPELSPAYKKWLVKKGKTGKMLNRTSGGLYHSITARADALSALVGTNKKYAAIHHFGGKAGRGRKVRIPARPYLVLADADTRKIVERMKRYLEE